MNTIFLVLCGTIIVSTLLFLVLLLRVPLGDKDFWLKTLSAVFASLVFAVGIPALIASHFSGKEQERKVDAQQERILLLDKEIADSKTKQAEAERQLLEVQARVSPRIVTNEQREKMMQILRDGPKAKVVVEYQRDDLEAYFLAERVWWIFWHTGGWDVGNGPIPVVREGLQDGFPSAVGLMGGYPVPDVTILANEIGPSDETPDTPYAVLSIALKAAGLKVGARKASSIDIVVPEGQFRLIVNGKPPF